MKRCFALALSLVLILSLTACGKKESPQSQPKDSPSSLSEPAPAPDSPEPSDAPQDGIGPSQSGGDTVIENISQEEQQSYLKKYIYPYHIVGLMYSTWSDPEEIEVWRYMHFFTYNEDENYYKALGNSFYHPHSVPADIVEGYITSYFEVDPAYLRTSEKYDATANCYLSMENEGIGGGPAPIIERIEIDGDRWKFICRDESGNRLSVTIQMFNDDTFHYIAGEVLELAEQTPVQKDERLDRVDLGNHANILTAHIVSTVFDPQGIREGDSPPPDKKKFTTFAMGVVEYLEDAAYQYHDIAARDRDGYWHFPEEKLKSMMWEVFGLEDWEPDREGWLLNYSEENREYTIDLAFDIWNHMECKIMTTLIDTQDMKVIVDYQLYTSSLYPDQHEIASMSTDYSILFREDDTPYLRYEGTLVSPPRGFILQ